MILNLIHRPERISETYDFQRKCAHELKLKVTMLVPSGKLDDPDVIAVVKEDHEAWGDEIGIWLNPLSDMPETQVWLLSSEDKRRTVKYSVDKYREHFGESPKVVGNYVMDAELIKILKDYCPEVTVTVAGCFEEGVKVFHGCNNSWYLFSEGMAWGPWYPSKNQSVRPARSEADWAGVVAVPHLSRDLVLGYEGRNDFFASHPANVQRGLANDGMIHEYDYNLADQYRMQADFNDGFSYYQIHVGSGWLHRNFNIIDPDEITQSVYRETLEYMAELRDRGDVVDMHMSEFGEYYKKYVPIEKTAVGVGKDILFGSGKHYTWIFNPDYRVLVDAFQGGSIGDLRPYIAEYASYTGPDSPSLVMNSYPYLIQSQYRSGVKHHCFDGSRTTLLVKHGKEELDMCFYPTKIEDISRNEDTTILRLTPAMLEFSDGLKLSLATTYRFMRGGKIEIARAILECSAPEAELEFTEYVKASYGFTEYPEDMKGIGLYLDEKRVCDYSYEGRSFSDNNAGSASATIPKINTGITLSGESRTPDTAEICEGHLFTPFYTMKLSYKLKCDEKETVSCLTIKRIEE